MRTILAVLVALALSGAFTYATSQHKADREGVAFEGRWKPVEWLDLERRAREALENLKRARADACRWPSRACREA